MKFWKKIVNSYEFYESIEEVPMFNWDKCLKGKRKYLFLVKPLRVTKKIEDKLEENYMFLKQKHLDLYGLDSNTVRYFALKQKINKLWEEAALGKMKMITHAKMAEKELEKFLQTGEVSESSYFDVCASISEGLPNVSFDPMTIKVPTYYAYIKRLEEKYGREQH